MARAIDASREAFLAQASGEGAFPQRTALPVSGAAGTGTTLVMPAHLPGTALLTKVVSVFPGNVARGTATIQGVVLVLDEASGAPLALLDAPSLTALRTGAASALATDLLAPRKARVAAVLGCGAQGRTQLLGLAAVRALREVRLWSRSSARAQALATELAQQVSAELRVVARPEAAVRGAHVVCTATPSTRPLFSADDLAPGVHVNAVGSYRPDMAEFDPAFVRDARVFVDDLDAAREEAGELLRAREAGWTDPARWTTLGALLCGEVSPPERGGRPTLFKSVGIAVQDATAAAAALAGARREGLGSLLEL